MRASTLIRMLAHNIVTLYRLQPPKKKTHQPELVYKRITDHYDSFGAWITLGFVVARPSNRSKPQHLQACAATFACFFSPAEGGSRRYVTP